MHRLARYAAPRSKSGREWRPYKGKDPLHRCPQSESLCSVIHPEACSAPNGFIYRVPLQQWERGKELCAFAINKSPSGHVIIFALFCPGPIIGLDLWMPHYCTCRLVCCSVLVGFVLSRYHKPSWALLEKQCLFCIFWGVSSSAEQNRWIRMTYDCDVKVFPKSLYFFMWERGHWKLVTIDIKRGYCGLV